MKRSDSLHPSITGVSLRVPRADLAILRQAGCRASRVPRSVFLCMPEVSDPARSAHPLPSQGVQYCLPRVRSASAPRSSPISGRNTLPARSPVNASRLPLPKATHDSGPVWLARPSLSGTCTLQHIAGFSRRTRTLALSRCRKRERSGRWRQSAAALCSARMSHGVTSSAGRAICPKPTLYPKMSSTAS